MTMIEASYPNDFKSNNLDLTFSIWCENLKDYDWSFVLGNLNHHLKTSRFLPTIADLVVDRSKNESGGRYIPDAITTMIEMQQKEQESYLALTTSVTNITSEQIQAAKEKALKTIANAVKRSEEENPYKVVD